MITLHDWLKQNNYYNKLDEYFIICTVDSITDKINHYRICLKKMLSNDYRWVYDRFIDSYIEYIIKDSNSEDYVLYIEGTLEMIEFIKNKSLREDCQ